MANVRGDRNGFRSTTSTVFDITQYVYKQYPPIGGDESRGRKTSKGSTPKIGDTYLGVTNLGACLLPSRTVDPSTQAVPGYTVRGDPRSTNMLRNEYIPERCEENHGTCYYCDTEDVALDENDKCEECLDLDAQFAAEDRATRHAENGYGYSGNWSGHESADLGGW